MIRFRLQNVALFATLICLLCSQPASAHPLGNFTINHMAKLNVKNGAVDVRYILDIAEIPTFQMMQERGIHANWSAPQLQAWADAEIPLVRDALELTIDGTRLALEPGRARARVRPGAGGLPILYWVGTFHGSMRPNVAHTMTLNDHVYENRQIGWKDIVVLPELEPTRELQVYPSALIGSPRGKTNVILQVAPNGAVLKNSSNVASVAAPQPGNSVVRSTMLSDMFANPNQTPLFVLLTIFAAFGLGALHAIEPGHGKALLAVTLVGARATPKQAVILGGSLTFAHTIGVILLGVALFFLASFVSETIYPWITLLSGVAIAIIGARSLSRYMRTRAGGTRAHAHPHGHPQAQLHDHTHEHALDHTHGAHVGHDHHHHSHAAATQHSHEGHEHGTGGHSHVIPGDEPINFRGAVWAAMSGGIAPCPAAIVVMLAALRLHKLGYGLLLIVIFSLGLATVLIGLGIAVVHGAGWLSRRSGFDRFVRYGPLVSASIISIIGAVMIGQGFVAQGVHASAAIITALVLFAIAGFVMTPQHPHRHSELPA
ncbi:MAG: hypothetical protein M3Z14_02965 [Candidatus Eremiobacteraeota bacterium]|nr:hypothetical protein [Candidatus Eremiobacteraeota bacterium]